MMTFSKIIITYQPGMGDVLFAWWALLCVFGLIDGTMMW